MKRLYPRALVLTSALVFGGIAIAQAQKYGASPTETASDTATTEPAASSLVPLANRGSEPAEPPAEDGAEIALASGQLPPSRSESAFADVEPHSAWAVDPPADELAAHQVSGSSRFSDDYVDSDEYIEHDTHLDNEQPEESPELPDPVAFPSEVSSAPLARRANPYRDTANDASSGYGSDEEANELDVQDDSLSELRADQIALPEIDSTALPASRYSQPRAAQPAPASDAQLPELPASDALAPPQAAADPAVAPRGGSGATPAGLAGRDSGSGGAARAALPAATDALAMPPEVDSYEATDSSNMETDEGVRLPAAHASVDEDPAGNDAYHSLPGNDDTYDTSESADGGRPGPQSMEGPQSPSLTIHKRAPAEIQVGRPAKFDILVRNTGRVTAERVVIRDQVPEGTRLIDSAPKASRAQDGALYWDVGSLTPGQEVAVSLQLMPTSEGQIGSVATVSFAASASAKTRATKPELVIEQTGPTQVLVGEAVQFSIKLSNPGTGAATQVVLEEDVPSGLTHSSGARLEYEVGTVEPGQTRHLELTLKADKPGHVTNTLIARADGGLVAQDSVELDVVAPELQVAIEGPNRRYLDRQATFTVAVANPGTAPARSVELVAQLPTGLKFVSTNNSGFYDQSRHAIIWSLEQLPAGEMGKAQFTALPIEMGEFQIHAQGQADMGLQARQDHLLSVEGIAALYFGVADKVDPIEVGGETTYEIKVVNQGSKSATNVQFAALLPEGMQAVSAQGPTQEALDGQRVMFAPIATLAPQEQAVFHVTVSGRSAGDHRFRVQMTSDETTTPVIKEESTRVYSD